MTINKFGVLGKSMAWENLLCQLGIPFKTYDISENYDFTDITALVLQTSDCISHLAGELFSLETDSILIDTPPFCQREFAEKALANLEVLMIDLEKTFSKISKRRQFYYERSELPSERVNIFSHYDVIQYVNNFLVEAFQKRGKTLMGCSGLPENKPLFIFRIDTDFAEKKEITALSELCRKYEIAATWFVDVYSENILQYYESFTDQEIGLHCDKHYVYKNKKKNYDNIKSGLDKLLDHNISPAGFAAPFGDWNTALEEALFEHNFSYSSEFAFAWDSLPIVREQNGKKLLQIPIHPISPGRLRRSHFSQKEMLDYYIKLIDKNCEMGIPAVIYHHPAHGMLDLIEDIFKYVKARKINNLSMYSYAAWWLRRYASLSEKEIPEFCKPLILKEQNSEFTIAHQRIYRKNWRWYLYEYESYKSRRYFKKHGYPAHIISR